MPLARVAYPSPNYSSRGAATVRLVVIHTAEGATTYQSLGNFFANPSSGVSSHVGIDDTPGVIGEYVHRGFKAWTAADYNPVAIQAELCAFAAWNPGEWDAHPTMLANCAAWIAEEAAAFGIPIVKLAPSYAQSGGRGVCQHKDLGVGGGNHSDCGPHFPIDRVLDMAAGLVPGTPQVPVTGTGPPKGKQMIASTASGNGYWVVTEDGAVYAFGDAKFKGGANDPNIVPAGHQIVGIAGRSNDGYWLTTDEGSVYAFGSAPYEGRADR